MVDREKEDGYVIVNLSEEELQDILDEEFVHKTIPTACGYAVGDDDEEFVFYKDENHLRSRANTKEPGDIRCKADGEQWMALLGGVEDRLRWFQAGIELRCEE